MPERERIPHASIGKNHAQRVVSGFFGNERLQRLLHTLRRVIEVRNTRSRMRSRSTARARRHQRLKALPLKRHPAPGYLKHAETFLISAQRVLAAKIHG